MTDEQKALTRLVARYVKRRDALIRLRERGTVWFPKTRARRLQWLINQDETIYPRCKLMYLVIKSVEAMQ